MHAKHAFALLALVLILSACTLGPGTPAALPTVTAASVPSSTPPALGLPTQTLAPPSPLPSPAPASLTPTAGTLASATPSPTPVLPTETPVPTGLNPSGPYVLFKGQAGIWIANPDGSFPVRISTLETNTDLYAAVSPAGDRLAYVVRTDQGLDLLLTDLPGGATQT
jgi:hypothetical protein